MGRSHKSFPSTSLVVLQNRLPSRIDGGCCIGNRCRNRQPNLRAGSGFAPEIQLRAHALGAFTDADQSPVPGAATFFQDDRSNALAIIADAQAKQALMVENLDVNVPRFRVLECIS